jgi:Rieske Fe-S protein
METRMPNVDARLDRRGVLRAGVVAFATIAVSGCASLFVKKRDPDVTVVAAGGDVRVPVSAAPWARDGGEGSLVVAVDGRDDKLLVFRRPDGSLAAVDMTCTHRGCDVNWAASRGKLVCPCHGSEFAPSGAVTNGPAVRALATHPVNVDGETIVVRLA